MTVLFKEMNTFIVFIDHFKKHDNSKFEVILFPSIYVKQSSIFRNLLHDRHFDFFFSYCQICKLQTY